MSAEDFANHKFAEQKAFYLQHYVIALAERGGTPFSVEINGEQVIIDQAYVESELKILHDLGYHLSGKAFPINSQKLIEVAETIIKSDGNPPFTR